MMTFSSFSITNKMTIIGTIPFRFSVKNQQVTILQRVHVMSVAEKLSSFPSKISPMVIFNITGHLKGCTERYRNNLAQTRKKL